MLSKEKIERQDVDGNSCLQRSSLIKKKKKLVFTDCAEILQIHKETVRGRTMQYDSVMKMNCLAYMLQHEQNS